MRIVSVLENQLIEKRIAITPEIAKKYISLGFEVSLAENYGDHLGIQDNIYKEIDLCQIVCLPCHHLITDIENKIGFTRIKTSLTKKLNNDEIDEEEYKNQVKHYQIIYKMKMEGIYGQITSI